MGPRAGLHRCGKFRPTWIRSLNRPARSQSVYRLSYRAHPVYNPTYWLFYSYILSNTMFKIWYCVIIAFEKNEVKKQQRFSCFSFRCSGVVNVDWIELNFTQRILLNKQTGLWSLHGWERKVKCRLSFVFWCKKCGLCEVWQKIRYSTLETYDWNMSVTVLPESLGTTFLPDPLSRDRLSISLPPRFFFACFYFCLCSLQFLFSFLWYDIDPNPKT